jgi:phage-related tail protein
LGERAKNIDGLNEMIASFADGSADSVNAIAGMAKASDADLQKMVDNWQTLQNTQSNVSESMADLTTCMSNAMDDIVNEVADAVADMDMSNAAMTSAQATIQGFVDGAESMMPRVEAAYSKIGAAAAQALVTANRNTNIESNNVSVPGYAVGTTSAAPGFAVVGEDGPELVYFAGGEQVVTATETRAMQRAMSFDAVEAETSQYTYGDKKIELSIAPVYQISGTDNGNLSDVLNQQNRDLKDLILSVIEEAEEDQRRGVYA